MTHDEAIQILEAQIPKVASSALISARPGQTRELDQVVRELRRAVCLLKSEVDTPVKQ
jgi:hypothetical protein